jgi:mono/diheme cytochrome c family protein
MAPWALRLALAAAIAATLAACAGGQSSRSTGSAARTTAAPAGASGKALFAEHCSMCHSLNGRENPHKQGGDLLGFRASRAQVVQFVREMPVVHGRMTDAELQAVVDYVIAAERGAGGH